MGREVRLFPGDADYFERVNVQAPTREEACRILADVMRSKALDKLKGDDYELVYVRWGSHLQDVVKGGEEIKLGGSIIWTAQEVQDGRFDVSTAHGRPGPALPDPGLSAGAQEPPPCLGR